MQSLCKCVLMALQEVRICKFVTIVVDAVPATPTLLAPADAEKQLSSSARPFQPIKWGVPDKAAGKVGCLL